MLLASYMACYERDHLAERSYSQHRFFDDFSFLDRNERFCADRLALFRKTGGGDEKRVL